MNISESLIASLSKEIYSIRCRMLNIKGVKETVRDLTLIKRLNEEVLELKHRRNEIKNVLNVIEEIYVGDELSMSLLIEVCNRPIMV